MKRIFPFFFSLFLMFSCNKNDSKKKLSEEELEHKNHMEIHKEMDKVDNEYLKFKKQLITLYSLSEKNPEKVIFKTDSLLQINENETDKYKSQIKETVKSQLHYLKAEIFYKIGKYEKSIQELNTYDKYDFVIGERASAYAANYAKLKQFDKARAFVDSIRKGYNFHDYSLANYYECTGNRIEALKIYRKIKNSKIHYPHPVEKRIHELQMKNPKLLNEIYFPTQNPKVDIYKNPI